MLEHYRAIEVQTIIESSHDGIIVIDHDAKINLVNAKAKNILGLPENAMGKKVTEFIPNSDLIRILETGKKEIGDIATISNKKLIINRLPIVENGQIVGVVSNFKEIIDLQRVEMGIRKKLHQSGLEAKYQLKDIVGSSEVMKECSRLATHYGNSDATVMILGHSGTGKEMFAQGIHLNSTRAKGPFVAINCAALPDSLLESELFGYEEGTFTGAMKGGKMGLFELAHGGTIFLDEIGEMDVKIQAMVLRIIEERSVRRIGGQKVIPIDVRIMVATNRNLGKMVHEGKFRDDLYYRLNVLTLELPSLKERLSDIPELVNRILDELNERSNKKIIGVHPQVLSVFFQYDWPGNVRELRNVLERMVLMARGNELVEEDIPFLKKQLSHKNQSDCFSDAEAEKQSILTALEKAKGNKTLAAHYLHIDRSTLWRRMKKYQI